MRLAELEQVAEEFSVVGEGRQAERADRRDTLGHGALRVGSGLESIAEQVGDQSLRFASSQPCELLTAGRWKLGDQAAAQARGWLASHLPDVTVEAATSNGAAAQLASADPTATVAAIGPRLAAEVLSLPMHPYLDAAAQDRIVDGLRDSLRA